MDNPLLKSDFHIPFDQIRPEHAEPATDQLIAQARAELKQLASAPARDFKDFIFELDRFGNHLNQVQTVIHHLHSVISSDEWNAAFEAILPKVTAFETDAALHPGLWQALKAFAASPQASTLDPVQQRLLKLRMDSFRREGADLPDDKKEDLKALETCLAQITNEYSKNVLESIAAFELYVPTERLAGVPQRVQDATRLDAEKRGKKGHRLTLHLPVYGPILDFADDRELRREMFMAMAAVGQQEERDNRPLVAEILELRRQKATLLGYQDFADLVLEDRMASSGKRALGFEQDLEGRTRPAYERENAEREAFYRKHAGADAPALEVWDAPYWEEKQRQAQYDFNSEALRPYFPMTQVLSGLFEVVKRVFGITVTENKAPTWHPEVKFYDMHNEAGQHIASFYTDWFPRDSKRGGAWMNQFVTGGPLLPAGTFKPHLALMCGNMTPPNADGVALLSLDEVTTIFHEFGHLLHGTLSKVPLRSLAGTNVPWDFVELPSQIMENWVDEREVLDLIGRHHETGEKVPPELFEKMKAARNYRAANRDMRQYSLGSVDLSLHIEFDPASGDPVTHAREIMKRFSPLPLPPEANFVTRFSHVFASPTGYAAGYYSYKWAEVLDADAYSRFAKEGIFNRQTGQDFINTILSRGNSQDPAQLFREFMGRDPDPEAALRRSGLA